MRALLSSLELPRHDPDALQHGRDSELQERNKPTFHIPQMREKESTMKQFTFGSFGSLLTFKEVEGLKLVARRGEAAGRRRAIEAQAAKSRRNLTNPESFRVCAMRVAKAAS